MYKPKNKGIPYDAHHVSLFGIEWDGILAV